MKILVTGGAGYIASHTIVELLDDGHEVVAVDNLVNSSEESLRRVAKITGKEIPFYKIDVCDHNALAKVFDEHKIDAVCHFAGLKAVGESVSKPLSYYRNNLDATITLCEVMQEKGVKRLVFSSSATVYGVPQELPLDENSPRGAVTNPYGQTKVMIEQILLDVAESDPGWDIVILRYFNPIGAHESGLIGEDPTGPPNNLLPYVAMVAVGKLPHVRVFGNDYDTSDGTGVRDYIHVIDLARGHVAALSRLPAGSQQVAIYNLGTGTGTSVFELIHAFEKACGHEIPYEVMPRRPGDVATCYADVSKAARELGWRTKYSIEQACEDSWRWQSQNPYGFEKSAATDR
jgi:UDP-glucose 4-epimerase